MTVQHKITGLIMTVKKQYGSVFVCYLSESNIHNLQNSHVVIDVAVCSIDNLIILN